MKFFLIVVLLLLLSFTLAKKENLNCKCECENEEEDHHPSSNVTCCFTVFTHITSVYLNGKNITDSVVYHVSNRALYIKTIEFQEPIHVHPSILAIGVFDDNELLNPSVVMSCTSNRKDSKWNFHSNLTDPTWTSVLSTSVLEDNLPENWYNLSYDGTTYPMKGPGQKIPYKIPNCLSPLAENLALFRGSVPFTYYLGVRKVVF